MSATVGQPVTVEFAEAAINAPGKIEFVSPITEADSGTVRVKVLLDNPEGQYRCGVRCTLTLQPKAKGPNAARPLAAGKPHP
jgi:multidrug efflux pump subunit AcrA (membrane-fusion protein)